MRETRLFSGRGVGGGRGPGSRKSRDVESISGEKGCLIAGAQRLAVESEGGGMEKGHCKVAQTMQQTTQNGPRVVTSVT